MGFTLDLLDRDMPRRLYLFVDESGNHSQRDCYTVTACWCLTEYDNPSDILKPIKRKIQTQYLDKTVGELKGEQLSTQELNYIFQYISNSISSDESIDHYNLPWNTGYPIGYTFYDSDSDIGMTISEDYLGESRSGITPQLLALSSLVSPALRMQTPERAPINSRHVVLDATTWERASHKLRQIIQEIEWTPSVYFETRRSHHIPGIQFADIAAYVRRQYVKNQSCITGFSDLANLRI